MSSETVEEDGYTCKTCDSKLADIVEVLSHDCERILAASELTASEQNTLMYIEERLVNNRGELNPRQMNHTDRTNMKLFHAADLVTVNDFTVQRFSDAAWELTSDCRKIQANSRINRDADIGTTNE